MLSHIEAFKPWLTKRKQEGKDVDEIIDALFTEPTDWQEPRDRDYRGFLGLQLPIQLDWLTETRLWLRDTAQENPWIGANFLVTPDPNGSTTAIDLYSGPDGFPIHALHHSVKQLSRAFLGAANRADRYQLWASTSRLIARAFEATLSSNFAVRIQPVMAKGDHVGYASLGDTYELCRGFVKGFLVACLDEGRENELRQLLSLTDAMNRWRSPAMIMLAKTLILDRRTNQEVTDIDGLCGFFGEDGLKWIILECKKKDSGGGERQLHEGLGRATAQPLGDIHFASHRTCDSWWTEILSPPYV